MRVSRCLTRNDGAIPQTVTRSPRIQSHTASASRFNIVLIIIIAIFINWVIILIITIAVVINLVIVTQLQQMNNMQLRSNFCSLVQQKEVDEGNGRPKGNSFRFDNSDSIQSVLIIPE